MEELNKVEGTMEQVVDSITFTDGETGITDVIRLDPVESSGTGKLKVVAGVLGGLAVVGGIAYGAIKLRNHFRSKKQEKVAYYRRDLEEDTEYYEDDYPDDEMDEHEDVPDSNTDIKNPKK